LSENSIKRPRPRRKQSRWVWPRWLVVTFVCLVLCLVAAVISFSINPQDQTLESAEPTPTPLPTATWTVYVPVMSPQCAEMLETADTLYDTSVLNEQQLLAVAKLAVDGAEQGSATKLIEAGKTVEKAQKLTPKLKAARTKFLDQYRKCADS